jgi:ABC-type tungstate transport system permease subunit
MNACTLADCAPWANFKNRQSLEILTEGDVALFNPADLYITTSANGGGLIKSAVCHRLC